MRASLGETPMAHCNHSYKNSQYRKMECKVCTGTQSKEYVVSKSLITSLMSCKEPEVTLFLLAVLAHRGVSTTESRLYKVAFWPLLSWYLSSRGDSGKVGVVDGWLTRELGACILCQLHKVAFCQEDDLLGWRSLWAMLGTAPFAGRREHIPKGRLEAPRQEVIDNGVDCGAQIEEDTCKWGMGEGRKNVNI